MQQKLLCFPTRILLPGITENHLRLIDKNSFMNLNKPTKTNNESNQDSQFSGYKVFFILFGILFFAYFFLKESNDPSNESSKVEKTQNDLPELQLAIINDRTDTPSQVSINLFSDLLVSLKKTYKLIDNKTIANALVAAHNIILKMGIKILC